MEFPDNATSLRHSDWAPWGKNQDRGENMERTTSRGRLKNNLGKSPEHGLPMNKTVTTSSGNLVNS